MHTCKICHQVACSLCADAWEIYSMTLAIYKQAETKYSPHYFLLVISDVYTHNAYSLSSLYGGS